MDHQKLFQVLVIGGALLGAGCTERVPDSSDSAAPDGGPDTSIADGAASDGASPPEDGAVADGATTGEGGIEDCGFCPNECCVVDEETGESREREGFMCCWGTSC